MSPQGTPEPHHQSLWERVRDHPFWWTAGTLAAIIAIWQLVMPEFSGPEIRQSGASTDNPFDLHFMVRNVSDIFPMNAVQFRCFLRDARYQDGAHDFSDMLYSDPTPVMIPASGSVEYRCPVAETIPDKSPAVSATIVLQGRFKTLNSMHWRYFESSEFNWDAKSKQWNEGHLLN